MINTIKETIKGILGIEKKIDEEDIECAIDEDVVDCTEMEEEPYVGVPAPILNPVDEWFASPYGCSSAITEKQQDYMVQEAEIKMVEEQERSEKTCESHDIHAKMYEIATKNWTTVAETQGGSENFQEGPGGWNSGTGLGQFQR